MATRSSKTGKKTTAGKKKATTKKKATKKETAKKKATSKASSKKAAAKSTKKSTASKSGTKPRSRRTAAASSPEVNVTMSHDEIASRAYSIWLAKGCPPNSAHRDWREAETQIRAEQVGPASR